VSGADPAPDLGALLQRHRGLAASIVRDRAAGLLRFETVDDLLQGATLRALEAAAGFRWQGEPSFLAWWRRIVESHVSDRRAHWGALKRRSGRVLRLAGEGETFGSAGVGEPVADATGPSTFAARRELIALTVRALDLLLPRDRDLVRWSADGMTLEEQARRLDVGYEAAGKARQRALDRFRKTFALLSGG
jgi:RNA polymerase sigma factor (sigma-70 family)